MNITLLASDKTLRSKVVEREEEIKSLQETIVSLTTKLKEREIDTKVSEKSTKGTWYNDVICVLLTYLSIILLKHTVKGVEKAIENMEYEDTVPGYKL